MNKWIARLFPWRANGPSKTGGREVGAKAGAGKADAGPVVPAGVDVRQSGHVFISYKSEEKEKADVVKAYVEKLGYPCWMAPDSLHRRGTQDYGDDIHRAIRECRCLLFILSPRALGSWWIRKEVQYAMAECRKPVIPFLIAPIPEAKREEDSLFIDIHLEKQILNEEGARNGTMDLGVLNRYLASVFAGDRPAASVADAAPPSPAEFSLPDAPLADPARSASLDDWLRWQSLAVFHLDRIRELKSVDPLHVQPTDLSPEARREELMLSSTEAALALMKILTTADPPVKDGEGPAPDDIRRTASRDLVRLVYENGDDFGPAVHEMAAPHAAAKPWAAFVAQARHYSPDGWTELKESNQAKARAFLEIAVRDSDNPYARIRMGECWHFGIGGDVSGSRALYWYREALKMECNDVLFRMSQLYVCGSFGIREDWTKAEELARQGIEAGVARCHLPLGDVLRERSWKEGKQDYSAAEEEYAKAYEGGCRDAMERIFNLRFIYDWKLTRPEFKDVDRLLQRASRASLAGSFDAFVDRTFWGIDGTEANADIAIDYALAGVRQNSAHCGRRLGELLVQKAADEEAGECDVSAIVAFVESNSELLQRGELKKFLRIFRSKTFSAGSHADFGKGVALPMSSFWTELFAKGALPSDVSDEVRYSPFRFLEFLRDFPAERNGDLDRVQRLWRAFRLLDDFQCAMDVRELGLAEVFPPESLRLEGTTLDHACAVLQDIPAALSLPSTSESLVQKIRTVEGLLRREGALNGSLAEEDIGREAVAFRRVLRESSAPNNRLLHVARRLADLEERLSHPFLAAALRLLRNAYLQKSGGFTGAEFGVLFFVLNARYRDPSKNGGVLFAARDAFWQVIHRGSFDAVLPFLELCLFGCRMGDSVIPTDFASIERIEPVLWELVEMEKVRTGNSWNRELCIRVAFAMAVVFLDRKLVTMAGKENWGRSSLYSVPKAMEWLSTVLELGSLKGWRDVCPELVDHARKLAESLKDKGYVVVQEAIKASVQRHLAEGMKKRPGEIVKRADEKASRQACIRELVEQVKASKVDAMGFANVVLEGYTLDFVASSDDKAVLFAVFPPDMDYAVGDEDADAGEPPKRTIDCLDADDAISPRLFDLLERQKGCLHQLEEDAEVLVAILASMGTIGALRKKWGDRLKASNVRLVPHDYFLTYLQIVFPVLPAEESGKTEKPEA